MRCPQSTADNEGKRRKKKCRPPGETLRVIHLPRAPLYLPGRPFSLLAPPRRATPPFNPLPRPSSMCFSYAWLFTASLRPLIFPATPSSSDPFNRAERRDLCVLVTVPSTPDISRHPSVYIHPASLPLSLLSAATCHDPVKEGRTNFLIIPRTRGHPDPVFFVEPLG